jgi:hypothetical protein
MLGEQLGEERGQVTLRRALPSENGMPRLEITIETNGTLLGTSHTDMATYVATALPNGTLFGEGQGVTMTADGGLATWKGQGAGRIGPGGTSTWRGAIYYQTASPSLARLNGIAVVYEYEVDESGKTQAVIWEWK